MHTELRLRTRRLAIEGQTLLLGRLSTDVRNEDWTRAAYMPASDADTKCIVAARSNNHLFVNMRRCCYNANLVFLCHGYFLLCHL